MHDLAYADAVRPARHFILRLPLLDYSLGHEVLLLQQRNPLVMQGFDSLDDNTQREAIIWAVLICSQTWAQNKKPHRWLRLWRWLNRKANYELAIADFRNYRLEGSLLPPQPDPEADAMANGKRDEDGRELGGPFLARLYNFVCTIPNCGEPMDYPFGMATFLYFSHLESEGQLKIENSNEAHVRESMIQFRREIAKEKEVKCPVSAQ